MTWRCRRWGHRMSMWINGSRCYYRGCTRRGCGFTEPWNGGTLDLDALARLLTDREAVMAALPEADRLEYERCRDSMIKARREAERMAPLVWIG